MSTHAMYAHYICSIYGGQWKLVQSHLQHFLLHKHPLCIRFHTAVSIICLLNLLLISVKKMKKWDAGRVKLLFTFTKSVSALTPLS